MKTIRTTMLILLTAVSITQAGIIGRVTFTGDFTPNTGYNFNDPGAAPFGLLSDQTATFANGIFAPFIQVGQTIAGQQLWTEGPNNLPLFSIGGFNIVTQIVNITGPDSGYYVVGYSELTGNGYEIGPDYFFWTFLAPPFFDGKGAITLQFAAFSKNVPDDGGTLLLLAIGLGMIALSIWLDVKRVNRALR